MLDVNAFDKLRIGLATADDLDAMAAEMDTFADDPETIVAFPRVFQAFGHRPTAA